MKNKDLFTSNSNEWYTPQKLFDKIQEVLDIKFTLDPCATKESAKCEKYYTKEDNGLSKNWNNEIVFINPPYSRELQPRFIEKAFVTSTYGSKCVLLIPSRTDTKIWHKIIFKYASKILFIKGRIKFQTLQDGKLVYKQASTFPSAIIVFDDDCRNQYIGTFEQ
jgi:site-specific DNA-methyltransferase (adenine-specific)